VKPEKKINNVGEVVEVHEEYGVVIETHPVYEYLYDYTSEP
jgi:hypothetical protein